MRHFFKTMWAIGFYFREEAIFSNGEMPKWIASTTVNSGYAVSYTHLTLPTNREV